MGSWKARVNISWGAEMKSLSSRRYKGRTNDKDIPQDTNAGSYKEELEVIEGTAVLTTWDIEARAV